MTNYQPLSNPAVQALHPYQPGKPISELYREDGFDHIIKLASNENPLGPSQKVQQVIQQQWQGQDFSRYPDGNGFELKQALAQHHHISPAMITLGNGSNDVLDMIARTFLSPNDNAIFCQYGFIVYPIAVQTVGAKANIVPAKNYGHDLTGFLAAINHNTRLMFIANPNNPTGTYNSTDELQAFLDKVPQSIIVVVDEAYFDYMQSDYADYPNASLWLVQYPNLIVTRTFSKAYGLAGLRIGYALSHPKIAELLNRVRQPFNVNSLAQIAAITALHDQAYLQQSVKLNQIGKQQLLQGFETLGLNCTGKAGNFLCVEFGNKALDINQALLKQGIIVRPIANYHLPEHLRISIGLEQENQALLNALGKIL